MSTHSSNSTISLPILQDHIKRDAESYRDEFTQQYRLFLTHYQLILQTGTTALISKVTTQDLKDLIIFLSHTIPYYPRDGADYGQQLMILLNSPVLQQGYNTNASNKVVKTPTNAAAIQALPQQHQQLHAISQLRLTILQSLFLLISKAPTLIDRMVLLPQLIQLFAIQDKQIRKLLFTYIVSDLRRCTVQQHAHNQRGPGKQHATIPNAHKIQQSLQAYMYTLLNPSNTNVDPTVQKFALDICIDLYKRKVWYDAKSVNCIALACLAAHRPKIATTALQFFLGISTYDEEKQQEDEEDRERVGKELGALKAGLKGIVKNKKKRERMVERAEKKMKGDSESLNSAATATRALGLLHDPQQFAEKLFTTLKSTSSSSGSKTAMSFSHRLLLMNVISRLIGFHKLIVLTFYPFLQRYLQPHQRHVTLILVYLTQASHALVPPEILTPVIRTLANNFVTDRSSSEVMAVGLNAIREIVSRCPLAIDDSLVGDLAQYSNAKKQGKSVMIAGRSLLGLFREMRPAALTRRMRGRVVMTDAQEHNKEYGAGDQTYADIPGMELVEQQDEAEAADDASQSDSEAEDMQLQDADLESDSEEEKEEDIEACDSDADIEAADVEGESDLEDADEESADAEEAKQEPADSAAAPVNKQLPVGATRIFTPEDFAKLRQARLKQAASVTSRKAGNKDTHKRKRDTDDDSTAMEFDPESDDEYKEPALVDEDDIIGWRKKQRLSRAERLQSILEGRGKDAVDERKGGTSNADKLKNKNFVMVQHSRHVREKQKGVSYKDKQIRTSKHIKKLQTISKRAAKNIRRGKAKK